MIGRNRQAKSNSTTGPVARWPWWPTALATVAVAALVVSCSAGARVAESASEPVNAVQVNVIGDSLSTGFMTPGDTWPEQAQTMVAGLGLKAEITNSSENGAGYVTPGEEGDVFLDLVNRVVTSQSQVVVLFGSDNDEGQPGIPEAVQETLARVKVLAPAASIIVVGPPSESDDAQGTLAIIHQTLQLSAASIGAQYVDPLDLRWFQGAAAVYLSDDLEHPNVSGETYLAAQMTEVLAPAIRAAMHQDQLAVSSPS